MQAYATIIVVLSKRAYGVPCEICYARYDLRRGSITWMSSNHSAQEIDEPALTGLLFYRRPAAPLRSRGLQAASQRLAFAACSLPLRRRSTSSALLATASECVTTITQWPPS